MTDSPQTSAAVVERRVVAGSAAAVATLATVAITSVGRGDGLVACPFRLCTGTYCPGCGGSRAASRLLGGDVVGAWQQHPYVVLLALQVLVLAGLTTRAGGAAWIARRWVALVVGNAAVLVLVWGVRIGLGDIPSAF